MKNILDDFILDKLENADLKSRIIAFALDFIFVALILFILSFILGSFIFSLFPQLIIIWLYFVIQESSSKQATFGKEIMGIIITDINGNRLNFMNASYRLLLKIVSTVLIFGIIIYYFNKNSFHDKWARTLVLSK